MDTYGIGYKLGFFLRTGKWPVSRAERFKMVTSAVEQAFKWDASRANIPQHLQALQNTEQQKIFRTSHNIQLKRVLPLPKELGEHVARIEQECIWIGGYVIYAYIDRHIKAGKSVSRAFDLVDFEGMELAVLQASGIKRDVEIDILNGA